MLERLWLLLDSMTLLVDSLMLRVDKERLLLEREPLRLRSTTAPGHGTPRAVVVGASTLGGEVLQVFWVRRAEAGASLILLGRVPPRTRPPAASHARRSSWGLRRLHGRFTTVSMTFVDLTKRRQVCPRNVARVLRRERRRRR